ncbi:MAG TPA: tRNA lysidine(34) synthetase TilS, partial [Gammaproteobacteria bacterium]|nr:tRNA lysidine(34) synthetase TilS [Gammaproteobacteria bacterium]
EVLLTAHHQDDQAETLLLNLIKGAGVRGLAAMPEVRPLGAGWLVRPLLPFSRQALTQYLHQQQVDWVEDPSNEDVVFDRNYLRHTVMPQLEQRWPAVKACIARSARHQAEQIELNQALAAVDLREVEHFPWGALKIPALRALSEVRRNNLLRHWLGHLGKAIHPSERQLSVLNTEILFSAQDASPRLKMGAVQVRKFAGYLFQQPVTDAAFEVTEAHAWLLSEPLMMPSRGLYFEPQAVINAVDGLDAQSTVVVRFRQGGERFRPRQRRHHKKLKQLFQEWQVPPWQRELIPLIYFQGELVMVWGFGVRDQPV